jgi:hypothetical protein
MAHRGVQIEAPAALSSTVSKKQMLLYHQSPSLVIIATLSHQY